MIVTIKTTRTFLGRVFHKLFKCPTFWQLKPAFKCPICGDTYRCYWDGNDVDGLGIDVCTPCAKAHELVLKHPAQLDA